MMAVADLVAVKLNVLPWLDATIASSTIVFPIEEPAVAKP